MEICEFPSLLTRHFCKHGPNKRAVVRKSPHEYELSGLKTRVRLVYPTECHPILGVPALHICAFLKEHPQQSVPLGCLASLLIVTCGFA